MRIAIDLSSAASGGGITYARELLPRLLGLPNVELGAILVRPAVAHVVPAGLRVLSATDRFAARSSGWRREVERCDVVFAPSEISFQRYEVPTVLAVRNASLALWLVRESPLREKARFIVQRELARRSARWAVAHVAVSHHAARLAHDNLRIQPQRVHVVYHGGPARQRPLVRRPARRFLFVSNLYRYKNVSRLISALEGLSGEWSLDIVGAEVDQRFSRDLQRQVQKLHLTERVHFRGHLVGEQLRRAYLDADCFVWPPYAETFGHPLLEAHSFGLPIVAARASSNEEIVGGAAVYFDPFDVDGLRQQLASAMSEVLPIGSLPRRYSWDGCAVATARVLEEAVIAKR